MGSVPNRTIALVDKLQFLAFLEGKEVVEDEATTMFFCFFWVSHFHLLYCTDPTRELGLVLDRN